MFNLVKMYKTRTKYKKYFRLPSIKGKKVLQLCQPFLFEFNRKMNVKSNPNSIPFLKKEYSKELEKT